MPRIILDYEPELPDAPQFASDSSDVVYFLSWAFSARYGANHELSVAAQVLRSEFKIDLVPLLTFADRNVEEPGDAEVLERSWQDAAPLAECCVRVAEALGSDEKRLVVLRQDYPTLQASVAELGRLAAWAADHGTRIRVTYELEDGAS